ncbi:MAG: hypothetical protein EBQ89_03030 [Alphaproteobacteria bacterium]|nr:hypothetical protein [Alphaproteobacteria bacterium]
MRRTVSTACSTFQQTLRHVWASGSTYAEMTAFLGVTRDQVIRLRDVLSLPLRLDRRLRRKGPRHGDPTPAQIRAMCEQFKAKHLQDRLNEPKDRVYHRSETDMVQFRFESPQTNGDDPLERLMDDFADG